jgi:hypothetical protein
MNSCVYKTLFAGFISLSAVVAETPAPQYVVPGEQISPEETADRAKLANLDKMPGFDGIAFGEAFPTKNFEIEQDRGALKIYKKENQNLLMGPALLETILYYVFEGKFYGVAFHTNDGQDSLAMKEILTNAFGSGHGSADEGPSTIWIAKKRGAIFEINTSTGDSSTFIFDHDLHDACLKDQDKAAQTSAQQLIQGKL